MLIGLCSFVLAGLVIAFAIITWADRLETRREAQTSLGEIARLVEEHTNVILHGTAVLLNRVADHVRGQPLDELRQSEDARDSLKAMLADMPPGSSIWIFDENGDLAATTHDFQGNVNVADRPYFRIAKETGQRLFLSPMIWGRAYPGYFMAISLRLTDQNGAFRGVALASVDSGYFDDFYQEVDPSNATTFAILKLDGDLVMRWPLPPPPDPSQPDSEPLNLGKGLVLSQYLQQAPVGAFTAVSVIDGIKRVMSYRKMADENLVVVVGTAEDQVFGEWRARSVRNAVYGLAAAAVVMLLTAAAYGSMGREAAALRAETAKSALLEKAINDNEILFQELHHRIKNNLQIISSFLTMQALRIEDDEAKELLQESIDRIHSMGLVHQTLYLQRQASAVDVATYLRSLADYLAHSHDAGQRGISITVEGEGVQLELDQAVPLALAVNEAITNSLKHAFRNKGGCVVVSINAEDDTVAVSVADNGIGFPAGAGAASGIGIHLLRALAAQLGGQVAFQENPAGRGALVSLRFPRVAPRDPVNA